MHVLVCVCALCVCAVCQPGRVDPNEQLMFFDAHDFDAFQLRCYPHLPLPSAQKVLALQHIRSGVPLDTRDATDSDEELAERRFRPGQLIDVHDPSKKWLPAHVVGVSEDARSLHVHFDGLVHKYDEQIMADSMRITRFGRFSSGHIVEAVAQQTAQPDSEVHSTQSAHRERSDMTAESNCTQTHAHLVYVLCMRKPPAPASNNATQQPSI